VTVIHLSKDWWKKSRPPVKDIVLKKPVDLSDRFYSIADLGLKLGVGYDSIYKAIRAGDLVAHAAGRSWRIPEQAVKDWLEACTKKKN
jgi:excisionase family DNA binding protein